MSDKSTRKAPDYAVESRAARNRSIFDRNCSIGLARPIRSGTIQANRCRKRRFLVTGNLAVRDFRELNVWRKAHQFVLDVYRATDSLPRSEVFGITVQLRRAAISIPTRIAEGCGRDGDAELAACLHKARGCGF